MREILFRGKYRNTGEWVFGDYMNYSNGAQIWTHDSNGCTWNIIVDTETVGQYTGLKDRNGVKVFEGDIVRLVYDGLEYIYVIVWDSEELDFKATNGKCDYGRNFQYLVCCEEIEVIGNAHDNPELLEVKQ